jgi:hypothetical protein
VGERKRELTIVRQTECSWCCKVAFKYIGKRGRSEKGFVLTAISTSHKGHPLAANPLIYRQHRERLEEYQIIKAQAQAHRISVLPYSLSRRVLDATDGTGLALTRREYYNLQKYQVLDGRDEKTIDGLLFALDGAGFYHSCRVEEVKSDNTISKKLIQIWFTHPKLLQESARFIAGCVLVVDATFNTNKAQMPIIVAVGVLNNGKTFPVAFSYCRSEDHASYAFFWSCLKEFWPINTADPTVVVSDQAGAILSSLKEQFPNTQHQICEWHAVEAMCKKFRQFHTAREVEGGKDQEGTVIEALKDAAWVYIKSASLEDLEHNREDLCRRLHRGARDYMEQTWQPKEPRVARCHTSRFFNLGMRSSQRVESYHPVLKQMTNGQLSLENSAIMLIRTLDRIVDDLETQRENELKGYSRLAQATTFALLRMNITNYALTKIALEWDDLVRSMAIPSSQPPEMGNCACPLLVQFGLPCIHHLYPFWLSGQPIPRSLCHPRWWVNGPPIIDRFWAPSTGSHLVIRAEPQPIFSTSERRIMDLRQEMTPEQRQGFDRQRARRQELLDRQTLELAESRVNL